MMRYLTSLGFLCFMLSAPVMAEEMAAQEAVEVTATEETTQAQTADTVETASSAPVVENPQLPVALVAYGDVDTALIERARLWAEANLAIPVPVLNPNPALQLATFDEVGQFAARDLETNRLGIVVLWRPSSEVKNHGAFFPEKHVSIVNLGAMFTENTDPEVIERRVERQVIRGICFVMGLEPNPNPQSAMFDYSSLEELDAIGRNLDPPWLMRLQQKALASGIPVDVKNPYNMVLP